VNSQAAAEARKRAAMRVLLIEDVYRALQALAVQL
jgi:hypothetical protein